MTADELERLAKAATHPAPGCLGAEALLINALTSHRHDFIRLIRAADAVVQRWETPNWKDATATANYINAMRDALAPFKE